MLAVGTPRPAERRLSEARSVALPAWQLRCLIAASVLALLASSAHAMRAELEAQLASPPGVPAAVAVDPDQAMLAAFYTLRDWRPAWSGDAAAAQRATAALAALRDATREGLTPDAYEAGRISGLLARGDVNALAELELVLSRAVLRYARDVGYGRLAPRVDFDVPIDDASARGFDPIGILNAATAASDPAAFMRSLAPAEPPYRALRDLLAQLRAQALAGPWTLVPTGESLRQGSTGPAVARLRQRLAESGDLHADALAPASPPAALAKASVPRGDAFDPALTAAVERFQARHGLPTDGVAGTLTLDALNTSLAQRIDQVIANLERRRHARRDLGLRYVVINVPDYHLTYRDSAPAGGGLAVSYDSRVVVGTIKDQTPTFTGAMTYLELNPVWHVPRSIAVKEFLPQIRKDPSYLERHNYVLYAGGQPVDAWAVDWANVGQAGFPYRIRQRPGQRNALGRVKFMFPNDYSVYIHDTPSKNLFARSQRTFSHGCIRLANPFDFAEILLGPQGWDKARFEAVVAGGKTRTVRLAEPLPVYITYVTAWLDPAGTVQFRDDIYGRDKLRVRQLAAAGHRPLVPPPPEPSPPPAPELLPALPEVQPPAAQAGPDPNG